MTSLIDSLPIGQDVGISGLRSAETLDLHTTPSIREYLEPKVREIKQGGLTAGDLS